MVKLTFASFLMSEFIENGEGPNWRGYVDNGPAAVKQWDHVQSMIEKFRDNPLRNNDFISFYNEKCTGDISVIPLDEAGVRRLAVEVVRVLDEYAKSQCLDNGVRTNVLGRDATGSIQLEDAVGLSAVFDA